MGDRDLGDRDLGDRELGDRELSERDLSLVIWVTRLVGILYRFNVTVYSIVLYRFIQAWQIKDAGGWET